MDAIAAGPEPTIERRVFRRWSITIPSTLRETFVSEDGYWHAWDDRRSVSLTSVLLSDRKGRTVKPRSILRRMPPPKGRPVPMPRGLEGWAAIIKAPQPARASRAISGMIVIPNNVLLVTVTSEDLVWASVVWASIRLEPPHGDINAVSLISSAHDANPDLADA